MTEHWVLDKTRERTVEQISENMNFYGVSPTVGRLLGAMYFHDRPMTLDDMKDELGMSKSRMSSAIRLLRDLKMVEKVWQKGIRKDLYEVEKDWYQSFINLFSVNCRRMISMNRSSIHQSLTEINDLQEPLTDEEKKEAQAIRNKLEDALEYYDWLSRLIESFESNEIFELIPKTKRTPQK